jgi:hypothetical protein
MRPQALCASGSLQPSAPGTHEKAPGNGPGCVSPSVWGWIAGLPERTVVVRAPGRRRRFHRATRRAAAAATAIARRQPPQAPLPVRGAFRPTHMHLTGPCGGGRVLRDGRARNESCGCDRPLGTRASQRAGPTGWVFQPSGAVHLGWRTPIRSSWRPCLVWTRRRRRCWCASAPGAGRGCRPPGRSIRPRRGAPRTALPVIRPRRSKRTTHTTSPGSAWSRSLFSSTRSVCAPEACSTKIRAQPAALSASI